MARKKQPDQMDLTKAAVSKPKAAAAAPSSPGVLPVVLEYTPPASPEKWRVERFDLLASQFELSALPETGGPATWPAVMSQFHDFAETSAQTSGWFILRRLFGVQPLVMPENAHPDDFRTHTREEISASLGLPAAQVQADMEFLKAGWVEFLRNAEVQQVEDRSQSVAKAEALVKTGGELALDDTVLERYGFSESFFKAMVWDPHFEHKNADGLVVATGREGPRPEAENRAEQNWFSAKLGSPEWQKMLDEPMTSELARETLLNELMIRRLQREMAPLSQVSSKFKELNTIRSGITANYRAQLEELQSKFPELAVAGRVSFRQVISDLNLAHRQFYGRKDRRLVDKVFTANEIIFLLRQSVQQPSARYRLGWTVAVVEAVNGFYNPDFRTQLKKSDLKKLDYGFKHGVAAARQELGEPMVDLEKGVMPGDGDDFPDFSTNEEKQKAIA